MITPVDWQYQMEDKNYNFRLDKFIEVDSLFAQLQLIKLGSGIGRMPGYLIAKEFSN